MSKVVREAARLAAGGVDVLRKVGAGVLRPDSVGSGGSDGDGTDARWRTVTVKRPPEEVAPGGRLPEPLAMLGDTVETSVRPAPGGKGTELAARLRVPVPAGAGGVVAEVSGEDPRQEIRSALRQAKQLLEVGEVLSIDGQPAGKRSPTPSGKLIETAAQRSRKARPASRSRSGKKGPPEQVASAPLPADDARSGARPADALGGRYAETRGCQRVYGRWRFWSDPASTSSAEASSRSASPRRRSAT